MGEIELLELADRVEKLTGACRDTDATIMGLFTHSVESDDGDWWYGPHDAMPIRVPDFTASIDATMTLVPEGWHLHSLGKSKFMRIPWLAMLVEVDDGAPYSGPQGNAATPALALCAAALRARASITRTTGDGENKA